MKSQVKDGKYMSSVKVGPKGQIVIPKEVRDLFQIQPGDTLMLLAGRGRRALRSNAMTSLRRLPTRFLRARQKNSIRTCRRKIQKYSRNLSVRRKSKTIDSFVPFAARF